MKPVQAFRKGLLLPVLSCAVLFHVLAGPMFWRTGENLVMSVATAAVCALGLLYSRRYSTIRLLLYWSGAACFYALAMGHPRSAPLLALYAMLYSVSFRTPRLLAHLFLFLSCINLFPEYFAAAWPVSALFLEALYHAFVTMRDSFIGLSYIAGFCLLGAILLPVTGMIFACSPQTLYVTFRENVVVGALVTSLATASSATAVSILLGVPLAYALARTGSGAKRLLVTLVDLPILVPQSVAGVALLMVFGPKTTLGRQLDGLLGLSIVNSYFAIVCAQVFVSSPFLVRSAMAAFAKVDRRYEDVARSLGASRARTFASITLPLAWPGILAGAVLTWSRAISEAGTVILLANQPFTISTLVNFRFQQYGTNEAAPVAASMIIACLALFTLFNALLYTSSGRD